MGEYIKIREFAEKFGISRQAVYQRIKKDLSGYVQKSGAETLIDTDAARLFVSAVLPDNSDSQLTAKQSSNADNVIDCLKEQISAKDEQIGVLQAQISQLLKINQEQFDRLDGQAGQLRTQVENQSQHIMQQNERLSVLLSQQQYLTHTIAAEPDADAPADIVADHADPEKNDRMPLWRRFFKK